MPYFEDTESKQKADAAQDENQLRDGMPNPDNSDEDEIPRVRGLIELFNRFFADKSA